MAHWDGYTAGSSKRCFSWYYSWSNSSCYQEHPTIFQVFRPFSWSLKERLKIWNCMFPLIRQKLDKLVILFQIHATLIPRNCPYLFELRNINFWMSSCTPHVSCSMLVINKQVRHDLSNCSRLNAWIMFIFCGLFLNFLIGLYKNFHWWLFLTKFLAQLVCSHIKYHKFLALNVNP